MSHRNSANVTHRNRQLALVAALVNARQIQFAIISLTLVLLITNGGAG